MTKEQLKDYGMRVTQASGTELVKLTLELAAIYIDEAALKVSDEKEFRMAINKARAFIGHLISSLNMKYDISKQLLNIYLYINNELLKISIRKDITLLPRIKGITETLSEAFAQICSEDSNGPIMENAQQVYVGLTYSKGSLNENMYIENNSRGYTV